MNPLGEQVVELSAIKKHLLALVIIVALILAISAYYLLTKKTYYVPPATYAKIYNLNNSGDYKEAQAFIENELKTNPAPDLKLSLANSILDEGSVRGTEKTSTEKARPILISIEKSGNKSVYLYNLLGYSYEIVNDFDKALEYYNKALVIDSKSVNTLFSIGHTYWLKGDLAKAGEFYAKAESNINQNTDKSVKIKVYAALGRMSGDPKKAEVYFLKALPLADSKPFKAELYADISTAQYLQKNLTKAVEYSNLAIQTDPSNELGYLNYAKAIITDKTLLQKNISTVNEYLVKSIFLAPHKAENQYWLGKLDFAIGKSDLAIKSYDTARSLIAGDNTLGQQGKNALMADILFDESVSYYLKKDLRYKAFLKEAYKYNSEKTFYMVDKNPDLKEMRTALIKSSFFLSTKFKI